MSPFNKENELLNIYPFYNIEQNINFIEQYEYEFENKIEKKKYFIHYFFYYNMVYNNKLLYL